MTKAVKSIGRIATSIVGGLFGSVFGSMFKTPKMRQPLIAAAPKPMPVPDDEAMAKARKKSVAAVMGRSGRASTILSDNGGSDSLGV